MRVGDLGKGDILREVDDPKADEGECEWRRTLCGVRGLREREERKVPVGWDILEGRKITDFMDFWLFLNLNFEGDKARIFSAGV